MIVSTFIINDKKGIITRFVRRPVLRRSYGPRVIFVVIVVVQVVMFDSFWVILGWSDSPRVTVIVVLLNGQDDVSWIR